MTQAYNLSQLANNLNSSGQLDAQDGLVNAVPIANGGTGASNQATARGNLDVPSTSGSGATGTWNIAINGNATTATTATTATNATNATTAATVSTTVSSTATGTTQSNGDNSARLATTAYVQNMSLGWGQTWQDVTASRIAGTTYTNSTGKPIEIFISGYVSGTGGSAIIVVNTFGIAQIAGGSVALAQQTGACVIPPGATYSLLASSYAITSWFELR